MTFATLTDSKKIETFKKAFGTTSNRIILPTLAAAIAKYNEIAAATTEGEGESATPFYGLTVGIKGSKAGDSVADIDATAYDSYAVALGYISERVSGGPDGKKVEGIRAILMFPVPTL